MSWHWEAWLSVQIAPHGHSRDPPVSCEAPLFRSEQGFWSFVEKCRPIGNVCLVHIEIESIKTTSMEDVSTRVLEKIKNI